MAERIPSSSEKHTGSHEHENLHSTEQQKRNQELSVENARKALEKHAETDFNRLEEEATQLAEKSNPKKLETPPERDKDLALPGMQQSIKNKAYKRELTKIQAKLPTTSRRFSKVIHNKTVESISDVGAKTIARPSGLLGGSIFALIGSFTVYYAARHYGFKYNYLLLFLLFTGGFLIGGIIEFLIWSAFRRKKRY